MDYKITDLRHFEGFYSLATVNGRLFLSLSPFLAMLAMAQWMAKLVHHFGPD